MTHPRGKGKKELVLELGCEGCLDLGGGEQQEGCSRSRKELH